MHKIVFTSELKVFKLHEVCHIKERTAMHSYLWLRIFFKVYTVCIKYLFRAKRLHVKEVIFFKLTLKRTEVEFHVVMRLVVFLYRVVRFKGFTEGLEIIYLII